MFYWSVCENNNKLYKESKNFKDLKNDLENNQTFVESLNVFKDTENNDFKQENKIYFLFENIEVPIYAETEIIKILHHHFYDFIMDFKTYCTLYFKKYNCIVNDYQYISSLSDIEYLDNIRMKYKKAEVNNIFYYSFLLILPFSFKVNEEKNKELLRFINFYIIRKRNNPLVNYLNTCVNNIKYNINHYDFIPMTFNFNGTIKDCQHLEKAEYLIQKVNNYNCHSLYFGLFSPRFEQYFMNNILLIFIDIDYTIIENNAFGDKATIDEIMKFLKND